MSLGDILLAGIIGLLVIALFSFKKTSGDNESVSAPGTPEQPTTSESVTAPAPADEVITNEALSQFCEKLAMFTASGENFETAFAHASEELGDKVRMNDALEAASVMKYEISDIVAVMHKQNRPLAWIAEFVDAQWNPDLPDLIRILAPIVPGASAQRAESILDAVETVWNLSDEGGTLVDSLRALGCDADWVARLIYRKTSMCLGEIIVAMTIWDSPELVAELAKEFDSDLTSIEEYETLRNGNLTLRQTAQLLAACGNSAESILNAENSYGDLSLDDTGDILASLSQANFGTEVVLDSIWSSDFVSDETGGAVAGALFDAGTSADDLAGLLIRADIDPEELDQEMRDDEMDLRSRMDIFRAYFDILDGLKQAT